MRSGPTEFSNLDLVASNDVDTGWHMVQLVPLFIENANEAHPAVLRELPRNRGSAGFRGLQVRDILPMLIYVHAFAAQDVKEVPAHPVNFLPRAAPAKSFEDAVKEFAKRGHPTTRSNIEMWFADRWCKEAELT
jgi:hypothetical protein